MKFSKPKKTKKKTKDEPDDNADGEEVNPDEVSKHKKTKKKTKEKPDDAAEEELSPISGRSGDAKVTKSRVKSQEETC
jgi:hypothetical protein